MFARICPSHSPHCRVITRGRLGRCITGMWRGALGVVLLAAPAVAPAATPVLRATLDNGLRVVIVRNTLAPAVTTEVNYLVGSNEAPPGFPGMAHAQEHMMFRGSPGLSQDQLSQISAGIGGDFDADTGQTVTQYYFTVPAADLEVALQVEAIRMRGVLDDEESWKRERQAIEQEVAQDLSNPRYLLYTDLLHTAFKGTPYAHDALGTRASFDRTSGAMLKQFHDAWYAPNNAVLVVVGDLDPPATLARIKKLFGDIPAHPTPSRPAIHLQALAAQTLERETDLPYGTAVIAFRMPGYRSPDHAAGVVLGDALASERSKLYGMVLDGQALATDFSLDLMPGVGLGYAIASFPSGANGRKVLARMREILHDAARHGVPDDLVDAAKRRERTQPELEKNSIPGLANAWSEALAVQGRRSPEAAVQEIERVSSKDVARVAARYLDLDHAVFALLKPHVSGRPVTSNEFGGKESFVAEKPVPVALPEWARAAVARIAVPRSTLHAVSTHLSNGVRLIVQPESISDTVSVYGHIRNRPALETPAGQEGVDRLLGALFSYGTTSLDQAQFQKALDDIGAQESAGEDFSLQVLAEDFERGVQLLAANELAPALPEAAFRTIREQTVAAVAGELQSPAFLTRQALKTALFPKHDAELRHATPQSVRGLKLADVRSYYRRVYRPDLTTIVVIGKVTPQRAQAIMEKYFGGWKAQGAAPVVELPPVPPSGPSVTAVPNDSRVQDKIVLAETLPLSRYSPDYYALQLGNRVLGGGFYASRLYRDLRDSAGLVYHVGSNFEFGRTRTVYSADYACDPPMASKARAILERDLQAMRTEPASAAELRQALSLLLKEIPLAEASVDDLAAGLLQRAALDLPLDEPYRAARRYADLSAEQVRAAYAKWLRVSDLAQVSEGPAPH